jgi:hypothetical protein
MGRSAYALSPLYGFGADEGYFVTGNCRLQMRPQLLRHFAA